MTEYTDMMAAHDALEGGVYIVEVFLKGDFIKHGVFSHSSKAQEWMRSLPNEYTCMAAPFVLDEPDFGNIKKGDQH